MTLGPMLAYNAAVTADDCTDPRGPKHVLDRIAIIRSIVQAEDIVTACGKIRDLISATGCPNCLSEIGVTDDAAIERLVSQVDVNRLSNNPRQTTAASLVSLLKRTSVGSTCENETVPE